MNTHMNKPAANIAINVIGKQLAGKLTLSALGLSLLLAISGCSGGDNTATTDEAVDSTPPVTEVETPVVEEELPEVEPVEVVEPVDETPVATETPTDTAEADAAEPEVLAADAGAKLYEAQCKACHATGLLGAPVFGDKAAWAPHLVKDIDTLHMHSAKGFNKMPAQASDTVSEAQVHAAVDYMVAAVS